MTPVVSLCDLPVCWVKHRKGYHQCPKAECGLFLHCGVYELFLGLALGVLKCWWVLVLACESAHAPSSGCWVGVSQQHAPETKPITGIACFFKPPLQVCISWQMTHVLTRSLILSLKTEDTCTYVYTCMNTYMYEYVPSVRVFNLWLQQPWLLLRTWPQIICRYILFGVYS